MTLLEAVRKRVNLNGHTMGGRLLAIKNILDHSRDVFQFMQLFNEADIGMFYESYGGEINKMYIEEVELVENNSLRAVTKLALEKTLMLIEVELK
ncbi:hypothetical protein LCGC14_0613030 [marine sediment metagenome]|uniref:Uncharacterized protein n=1 Tax=marine sediment metagenome TaxID=412755 RepID=A0A0F9TTE4_9ZZZZ